jgi:hypothetical protein
MDTHLEKRDRPTQVISVTLCLVHRKDNSMRKNGFRPRNSNADFVCWRIVNMVFIDVRRYPGFLRAFFAAAFGIRNDNAL